MAWTNAPQVVYHGTDETAANDILKTTISLSRCNPRSGFGQGFYVTSVLHEARFWADWRAHNTKGRSAVMAFDLNLDAIASAADHVVFTLADNNFHDFVRHNRLKMGPDHGRTGNSSAHRSHVPPRPNYDIVYGPVSRYPEHLHYVDWDQICFLHPDSLSWLENKRIHETAARGYFIFP
jgi:Protein of unknown function (DUF3990)